MCSTCKCQKWLNGKIRNYSVLPLALFQALTLFFPLTRSVYKRHRWRTYVLFDSAAVEGHAVLWNRSFVRNPLKHFQFSFHSCDLEKTIKVSIFITYIYKWQTNIDILPSVRIGGDKHSGSRCPLGLRADRLSGASEQCCEAWPSVDDWVRGFPYF